MINAAGDQQHQVGISKVLICLIERTKKDLQADPSKHISSTNISVAHLLFVLQEFYSASKYGSKMRLKLVFKPLINCYPTINL